MRGRAAAWKREMEQLFQSVFLGSRAGMPSIRVLVEHALMQGRMPSPRILKERTRI